MLLCRSVYNGVSGQDLEIAVEQPRFFHSNLNYAAIIATNTKKRLNRFLLYANKFHFSKFQAEAECLLLALR